MTDTTTADGTEAPPASEATERGRGRPRPQETIERDERVYTYVTSEPTTVRDIVEESGLERSRVYLSLIRLRRLGKVDRVANETSGAITRYWVRTG